MKFLDKLSPILQTNLKFLKQIPLLSILNTCPLLCFSLKLLPLSPFLLLTWYVFSTHIHICLSGNQLWKLYEQVVPCCKLPVMLTNLLSANSGCIPRVRFLFWYGSILLLVSTFSINSVLHV